MTKLPKQTDLPFPSFPNILSEALEYGKKSGTGQMDLLLVETIAVQYSQRMNKLEKLERAESMDLGIRLFRGKRQVIVSTSDISTPNIKKLIDQGLAMVDLVPEDPYCGLAESSQLITKIPNLLMVDPVEPDISKLQERAQICEEAALSVQGIYNSEGAESAWVKSNTHFAASNGFQQSYSNTRHSLSVAVIAKSDQGMERDYDFSSTVFGKNLKDPADIGQKAAEQAVRRLNPQRINSGKMPVIFHPRIANSFLGHLAAAIHGASVARGTSFLKNQLHQQIFPSSVTVMDHPLLEKGLASRPFDAEGLPCKPQAMIDKGVLTDWLLDLRSARQLKMTPNGHAVRGPSSLPSAGISNFYLEAGTVTPESLIKGIKSGLYVTELIGDGVNLITGDYSRGATGFWIENGSIAYPVSELTIAGNLQEIFRNLIVANDLSFNYRVNSPTLLVDSLMVAGS